jgi:UDP-GlcNAc:undecaprenyl-phosphate GlcNAc-1-phosphate transferase
MTTYTVMMIAAFVVAAALTPFVERLAVKLGAVDQPGERKVHKTPVPRLGGLAIFAAVFIPILFVPLLGNRISGILSAGFYQALGLFGACLGVFLVGALDDVKPQKPLVKLAVEIAAATVVYYCGFRIHTMAVPFHSPIALGWLAAPVTVLWVVGITNAVNLIDGIDGAAAGISAIAAFAIAVGTDPTGSTLAWVFASGIIGAALGFLLHNFSPAKIFMGDSGALFLGFLLASISIPSAQKSTVAITLAVPIAALALPIADTGMAILRRIIRRKPIMSGDNHHIHHKLLLTGMGHASAALALYGISAISAMAALALAYSERANASFVGAFLVTFFLVILWKIGALEFREH